MPAAQSRPSVAPGTALFAEAEHPAQRTAEREAQKLDADVYRENEPQIRQLIRNLLPITLAKVEVWGAEALESSKDAALRLSVLTRQFAELQSVEILQDLADFYAPRKSLIGRIKSAFQGSLSDHEFQANRVKSELQALAERVRKLRPDVADESRGLVSSFVALRAVANSAGPAPDSVLDQVLTSRMNTLRASLSQTNLVLPQLAQLDANITQLISQADHLINVVFSAVRLANSRVS